MKPAETEKEPEPRKGGGGCGSRTEESRTPDGVGEEMEGESPEESSNWREGWGENQGWGRPRSVQSPERSRKAGERRQIQGAGDDDRVTARTDERGKPG